MAVPYSIPTSLSSVLSHQILFSTCLVLCSKSKGSPAKFSQIRKDSWRPWANQRGGRKIKRMRRKRNGKPRVLGREKNSLPKMGRWEMPMSRQNRCQYSGQTKGSSPSWAFPTSLLPHFASRFVSARSSIPLTLPSDTSLCSHFLCHAVPHLARV